MVKKQTNNKNKVDPYVCQAIIKIDDCADVPPLIQWWMGVTCIFESGIREKWLMLQTDCYCVAQNTGHPVNHPSFCSGSNADDGGSHAGSHSEKCSAERVWLHHIFDVFLQVISSAPPPHIPDCQMEIRMSENLCCPFNRPLNTNRISEQSKGWWYHS